MSDGATMSSFSGRWAKKIVESTKRFRNPKPDSDTDPFAAKLKNKLKEAATNWKQELPKDLPWYAQEKAEKGAFASLLWFRLDKKANKAYAVAIGDTNLFHFRGQEKIKAWPMEKFGDFNNHPILIPSKIEELENFKVPSPFSKEYSWEKGDVFLLATDALAAYILHQYETKPDDFSKALSELINLNSSGEFVDVVTRLRMEELMKNDDTTMIVIQTD